ncbi:MAG: hypothetical protein V1744_03535, partial [Candidatus Altiarchaeota archaeon]
VVALGLVLFTFSVAYNLASKTPKLAVNAMEIEKSGSEGSNLAYNLQKIFRESSGITVEQAGDSIKVTETLPNNLTEYDTRIRQLKELTELHLSNATIAMPAQPTVEGSPGFNYTHQSDKTILVHLPDETREITLTAHICRNITNCNITSESAGNVILTASVSGNIGTCSKSRQVNITPQTTLDVNDGGILLEIKDQILSLTNNHQEPLNYTLTLRLNESRHMLSPTLAGTVTTQVGDSRKTTQVKLT